MFGSVWNSGKFLAAVAAILLAGGCGGGSSSSSPPPPPPPPPPPANQAPTADAGPDQTVVEGSSVSLDGSGSADSDGTVDVYTWTQTGGTTVTLDLSTPSMPTFTAPDVAANENLTFELVVTDDDGDDSAADTVVVTVTDVPPVNQAPTANAGPDQVVDEGAAVALDGSGSSDSDGTVADYAWTQTGGTVVTLDVSTPSMPTFTAPEVAADEALTFQLVVTDDDGATSAPDSVVVTVTNLPNAPVADAGPDQTVDEGAAVTLDGSGSSDPDGTVETYSWIQTAGTAVTLDLTVPSMPTFTAPEVDADENLTFDLVVTDNDGQLSVADTVVVTVTNVLIAPIADAGPDQVANSLDTVTLDGSGSSDSNGTIESYAWTQTAGTTVTLDETDPVRPTFTAPNVGADEILTFGLVVTDNDGETSAADSVNVTINPTLALPFTENFNDGNADGWVTVDDGIENASNWNVPTTFYTQTVATNDFGKDVDETYRRGTYAYYAESVNLTDYRFSVDVTARAASADDVGVMFRFVDNDNYYRFAINSESGSSRLESKVGGTFVTLARDFRGYQPGEITLNIVVEVEGPLIQVFVNGNPLFAATATDHLTGGIGLYNRDGVRYDNVSVTSNSTSPEIVISDPVAHTVLPTSAPGVLSRDLTVTAVARNVPSGGSVRVRVNNLPGSCNAATEVSSGVYEADCLGVAAQSASHQIYASILDPGSTVVDEDTNPSVGVGVSGTGDKYDALGDSITLGILDKYKRDNLSLTDQRTVAFQGWTGMLGDLLTTANGQPNLVGNEGIPGDLVSNTAFQRLASIIERNPDSNRALVMLGTNDTSPGAGPTSVSDFITRLEILVNNLKFTPLGSRNRDTVYIASIPPVFGDTLDTPYPDPLGLGATRNATALSYNEAIQANVWDPVVRLGPDFFACFLTATNNRFSLFSDSLHPNALGHAMMAEMWADVIVNGAASPYYPPAADPCPPPVYIVESLDPYTWGHKQNLLEEGNEYYNDASFTLTGIPTELEDGVWITSSNADAGNVSAGFLSFDVGTAGVTVYIAYDSTGAEPVSNLTTSAATLSSPLTVSDPAIPGGALTVVEAAGAGTVTIDGPSSGSVSGQQAYVVIVVP